MAERTPRPCRFKHCHYAGRKQKWFEASKGSSHRGGKAVCKYVLAYTGYYISCTVEAKLIGINLGENNLSFIETSALDASNVELAFQNILTGTLTSSLPQYLHELYPKWRTYVLLGVMKEISLPKIEQPVSNEISIREQQRNKRQKYQQAVSHKSTALSLVLFHFTNPRV